MKLISVALLIAVAAAQTTTTTYPADTLFCRAYSSATVCTACPTGGNMKGGPRNLASNSCAAARVNVVAVNPKKVAGYTQADAVIAAVTDFTCVEGYYALYTSTATQVGCYSSGDVDKNTTLFGANAKTAKVIANCASFTYSNSTFTCNTCKGSFSPNAANAKTAKVIANCASFTYSNS